MPPRLIRAAQRYGELVETFAGMTQQITKVPAVAARLSDLGQANPPLTLDIEDVLPWRDSTELRLLVSEILHHLRVTADHLVYNVAWLDSGSEQARTQFPIFKKPSDFNVKASSMLAGISAEHCKWFEAVQPYNGVSWTETLAYLSNNDKHNYLIEVVPTLAYRVDLHSGTQSADDLETVSLPVDNLKTHLRLIRRDGGPYEEVEKALGEIVIGLAELINQFFREVGISEIRVEVGTS